MKAIRLVAWNLRRLRAERGLSQEALAFSADVDMSHLAALEAEQANVTLNFLEQLTDALGAHVSELFRPFPEGAQRPTGLKRGRKPVSAKRLSAQ
ncbi:helix-turn-helix domain-containing protein [Aquabacter cavernae]|uniref:helix-turn-helix domain-containing protein n=1 Tax=Aquabacter cavernae TaxID=2496029 RepID=UPI000F8E00E4|nr:helix-turn-helix transcriptional regulator [Aquabacter cavernae]